MQSGFMLGHYRVLAKLGAGGMGEVWRARDTKLERDVALKILPREVAGDPERLRRFVTEARAASALNHPNVAHIYEIGEADGRHFIAMELVEGDSLALRIDKGPLAQSEVLELGRQISEALDAAHEKGITHRDIKPANIMITPRGQVKVLDFGLAKINRPAADDEATQAMTQPGVVMGTMRYMSPEQALGREVDHRTDLFSLGVVLYEMTTGKQPFAGPTAAQTLDRILHAQPPPVTGAGDRLRRVIERCLEKDREKRYGSARELLAELRGRPPEVTSRRRWWPLAAGALATAVVAAALALWWAVRSPAVDSVAVLPFSHTGGNPELEYLTEGVTDNLINSLAQVAGLKVTARSLAYRHQGKDSDPLRAARDLKVRAVVTGRLVQRGDTLTLQAELMDVSDGSQMWGRQYRRKAGDLGALEEELARDIRTRLRPGDQGPAPPRRRYQDNVAAYQAYLKGKHYAYRYTVEDRQRAHEYLQQAITIDPLYAPAYAALAEVLCLLGTQETLAHAKGYATKALEIDDQLAEAHNALGVVRYVYDWDWRGAERAFRRAIELNPNYVWAHDWYGFYLILMGRSEEGIRELSRAVELDPLSPAVSSDLADGYRLSGQPGRAIEQNLRSLESDPNFWLAHLLLGLAYRDLGRHEEALRALEKARAVSDTDAMPLAFIGQIYGLAGRPADARRVLSGLDRRAKDGHVSPYYYAIVWMGLDRNQALAWLEKAYAERFWMTFLKVEPMWQPLRADRRFQDLLKRVGL
jgi:serine/threonine-protein kinase